MAEVEDNVLEHISTNTDGHNAQPKKNGTKISLLVQKLPLLRELFDFHGKVGEGTFSSVYLASQKSLIFKEQQKFAVKHLIPTCHPMRVYRELWCMQEMGGIDNIAGIYMCLRNDDCIAFIMPYLEHDKFVTYVMDMTVEETQLYMKQLLLAVRRVHSFGIIHRDIKPSNFLYNRKTKKFLLVDFGLAQKVEECSERKDDENIILPPKKRKRDDADCCESDIDAQPVKRQALQQLSNNFTTLSESTTKKNTEYLKRYPLLTYNKQSNISFVRVQNSQIKCMSNGIGEKLFAKPQPLAKKCICDGKPRICNVCLTRKAQNAPRAGTPGFRPPEVLLRYQHQTTAVDMWAVGVIMLSIMSGTYPFFRSLDDVTALAEMITVFGSEQIKSVAKKLGRNIVCSEERCGLNLKKVCELSRRSKREAREGKAIREHPAEFMKCESCHHRASINDGCLCNSSHPLPRLSPLDLYPDTAYDLLNKLLDLDPTSRITADQALNHPFITETLPH